MKRTIIKIDENLCNGCGICVKGCHEGALQIINDKAVLVSELYCDGLGACIGDCPVNAIILEEREAEPYREDLVMERLVPKGEKVILAHLKHLKEHGEKELLKQGINYLNTHQIPVPAGFSGENNEIPLPCGCPGSMAREVHPLKQPSSGMGFRPVSPVSLPSELRQFPVQLALLSPYAGFLQGADLLLAADCTAFAYGDFHQRFLKNRKLAVACPKLDSRLDSYVEKLTCMIDEAGIDTLTVIIMEVPCCRGLLQIAETARENACRHIPLKVVIIGVDGTIQQEEWR